jgi:hypothetical protein
MAAVRNYRGRKFELTGEPGSEPLSSPIEEVAQ